MMLTRREFLGLVLMGGVSLSDRRAPELAHDGMRNAVVNGVIAQAVPAVRRRFQRLRRQG
jgi:hypothetical protein